MTATTRSGHRTWALLAALSVSAWAATVHADYRLGLMQLESDEVGEDAFAPAFFEQLRTALKDRGDISLVETKVSLSQLSTAQGCSTSEPTCLARIALQLELDGFLFGKWTREGGDPIVVVRRYDTRSASVDGSALASFGSRDTSPAALQREAGKVVVALLGESPQPSAATPAEAPATPSVKPAALAQESTPSQSSGSSVRAIAGYALLVAAAASAGMAVFSFVQVDRASKDDAFADYRRSVGQAMPQVVDVCDEADAGKRYNLSASDFRDVKSACSKGATFEILQFVFIGGAIATGGLAALLLATGGDERPPSERAELPRFQLRPSVGRSSAMLDAQLRF